MAVRMIKKSWWVDFTVDGTRYRKRSPENSRVGALAYEAALRHKLARGERIDKGTGAARHDRVFERFALRWYEDYVMSNNKYLEQRQKNYILQCSLIPFFGKFLVEEITTQHIERYKAQCLAEGVARKTVNNRLAVFSKCLTTAYEWLRLSGTPPKVVWLKCPPP